MKSCPHCGGHLSFDVAVTAAAPLPPPAASPPIRSAYGRFGLSKMEAWTADQIAEGKSNREIAAIRGTTVQVIKNYANRAFQKTGCKTRTELTRLILLGRASLLA
jgi:DNA-binding CsgD family transcriptional regulator